MPVDRKAVEVPVNGKMARVGELIHPWGRTVQVCKALPPDDGTWLLLSLMDTEMEQKTFARAVASCQVPGDVSVCSSNEATPGAVAVAGVTTWLSQ